MAIRDNGTEVEPSQTRRDPVHLKHEELFGRYRLDFIAYVMAIDVLNYIVSNMGDDSNAMFVLDVNYLGDLIEKYQIASKANDQFGIKDYLFQLRHHVERMKQLYKIPSILKG